jgi:RES domain-containing protein
VDVWRICLARHAPDGATAFSGEGSRLYGGRWSSKGTTVAYAGATLSLAALEFLVHAEIARLSMVELVACVARCREDISVESVPESRLPAGWRAAPAPRALAALGDSWVREKRSALLRVPSAIIPRELNVLVNPAHPDAARIEYGKPEPFRFDGRLVAGRRS